MKTPARGAEEGRIPLCVEPLDAAELLDSVRTRFASRAHAEGRRIEIGASPDVELRGDRLRLEQALGNLVDNALRHGSGTVELSAASGEDRVELRVRDHGVGFPTAFLPLALERFSRPDTSRSSPGAGLGLAIVLTIAVAHDGNAGVTNADDGGAEVVISLPRA